MGKDSDSDVVNAESRYTRYWYRFLADVTLYFHTFIVLLIVFGWIWMETFWLHFASVFIAVCSEIVLGYCFLTRWEFFFRHRADPSISESNKYVTYYMELIFGQQVHDSFLRIVVPVFFTSLLCVDCVYLAYLYLL
ncbi:MAG: hypothetical protein RI911_448 [Candidatus Parcubacteria bacterium]|jgi:small-conductance mechanosensitive channel